MFFLSTILMLGGSFFYVQGCPMFTVFNTIQFCRTRGQIISSKCLSRVTSGLAESPAGFDEMSIIHSHKNEHANVSYLIHAMQLANLEIVQLYASNYKNGFRLAKKRKKKEINNNNNSINSSNSSNSNSNSHSYSNSNSNSNNSNSNSNSNSSNSNSNSNSNTNSNSNSDNHKNEEKAQLKKR